MFYKIATCNYFLVLSHQLSNLEYRLTLVRLNLVRSNIFYYFTCDMSYQSSSLGTVTKNTDFTKFSKQKFI